MKWMKRILLVVLFIAPVGSALGFKKNKNNNYEKISTCLRTTKNNNQKIVTNWSNFAKQVIGSYGAAYIVKMIYRLLALSNSDLATCALVQLLFCYIAVSASDDMQHLLTDDSNFCATLIGALFALATGSPAELYEKANVQLPKNWR